MTQLSGHFKRSEFACKCGCGMDTIDAELITILEGIRIYFGQPVSIESGNRCKKDNRRVGGRPKSQHLISRAADIKVRGTAPSVVADYIDPWHKGGLGRYPTFTHVDSRGQRARWSR